MLRGVIHRAFRFRLAPSPEQEITLRQFAGVTRLVYNLALEQRRDFWRQYRGATGRQLNAISQGLQLKTLRREFGWIAATPFCALAHALRDLDKAFSNFFAGRARYPTPRRKGVADNFRITGTGTRTEIINGRWASVRVPNLGWVKFRATRQMRGRMVSAAFSRDALGWHVSFTCEIEHEAPGNDNPSVGIDRGIAVSLALSNGEAFNLPDLTAIEKRKRRAQRALSRCKRGSKRRLKRVRRVASLSAKAARIRAHWQHRVSLDIAERFGLVAIEHLKITSMTATSAGTRKRGLNRAILNQGWNALAIKLNYKLRERGGALVKVDPRYSSQTCSDCGAIDSGSRKNQTDFVCTSCGFALNADHNAALIILRRSTSHLPVEGCGYAPDEAGTMLEAA